jgi:nucleoside-diphosphate-sugar epimerase
MREYDEVILLDDMSAERYCSLFNIMPDANIRFVQGDICDPAFPLESLVASAHVVVHLAARTNAEASVADPAGTWYTNYIGTHRIAKLCAKHDVGLVFPSTTSVYGVSQSIVDENGPIKPQSPYALSKYAAEVALSAVEGLSYVVLRFGTIVGYSVGMRFHTAVNKFIWQACTGQPLTIWRTAWDQVRPYLALDDCLRAIDFVTLHEMFERQTYNVVSENRPLSFIVGVIEHFVSDVLERELVESPIMNQLSYEVSAGKLRREGFAADQSISHAIAQTVEALRGLL